MGLRGHRKLIALCIQNSSSSPQRSLFEEEVGGKISWVGRWEKIYGFFLHLLFIHVEAEWDVHVPWNTRRGQRMGGSLYSLSTKDAGGQT